MMGGAKAVWTLVILLAYGLLCLWSFRHALLARLQGAKRLSEGEDSFVLVAYASQSGTAAELARRSADMLQGHLPVRLMPLNQVNDGVLSSAQRALFVASTYGEGEPPDNGLAFQRRYLTNAATLDLSHLEFAVLALGDRAYQRFCDFGRRIQAGMERLGASPLWELTEAASDELWTPDGKVAHWRSRLGSFIPAAAEVVFAEPSQSAGDREFGQWRLADREHLNPGSLGEPLFDLWLTPHATPASWCAGDIAVILPRNDAVRCATVAAKLGYSSGEPVTLDGVTRPLCDWLAERQLSNVDDDIGAEPSLSAWLTGLPTLPEREYSIASVPEEGAVRLLVRQQRDERGQLGLGSGWLTASAGTGDSIALRIRSNPSFQVPEQDCPLILIGNGSGLAGLRAHLKARELAGATGRNWLVFGERSRLSDSLWNEELVRWRDSGHLARLDRVFSRDGDSLRYVQDVLAAEADELCRWADAGAIICVCGSLTGMGSGVQTALEACLGAERLDELKMAGRYRRDLY
ncbi:MAG: sulfite reductase subunit alpha [Porticoccaceae bacterium]|nr:sulfite reductase subunit alpha [Porticoccaceae bacterium]